MVTYITPSISRRICRHLYSVRVCSAIRHSVLTSFRMDEVLKTLCIT